MLSLLTPSVVWAEPIRIATWTVELSRKHAAVLYRDLTADPDKKKALDAAHLADLVAGVAPDVLVIQGFDYDHYAYALRAWAAMIAARGHAFPHHFAQRPNTGQMTDVDLNGNGRTGDPQDAQGYGWFAGQGGMAVLSKWPMHLKRDYTDLIWYAQDWAQLPAGMTEAVQRVQRLSTTAHWVVQVAHPGGRFDLLTSHHSPPVFDGPEDRNGLRSADELRLWHRHLDGQSDPFILLGNFNLDPVHGDGHHAVMQQLLEDPRLQDTARQRVGLAGDAATARFAGVGDLRVSYILVPTGTKVPGAGIVWPDKDALPDDQRITRHGLVWADVVLGCRGEGG